MLPFVIKCNDITNHHLSVFRVLVNLMPKTPEKSPTGPGLTCDEVCDWLLENEKYLKDNLVKVTGHFGERYGRAFEHSWLEFKSREHRVIIDPYPWAVASGPILLYAGSYTPWHTLYRPNVQLAGLEPESKEE